MRMVLCIIIYIASLAGLLRLSNGSPIPKSNKRQSRMFGNLLGWFGGGGNNQHNRPGGGGPGPIQTLILGYVAQQAIYYYFGDENDESDDSDENDDW